jgi:NAD(P)-dependent dehydrogenase (short-subunit alcohol dehydrogenase family)
MDSRNGMKVAFVTGASSGIGKATALQFGKEGYHVVVADVLETQGMATVEEIRKAGGRASFVSCDVSNEDDVKQSVADTVARFGRIDCAFNNAGIEGDQAPTAECTTKNFNHVIDVNLKGVWFCMKYEIPQMLRQGGGAIVNTSSVAGLVGFEGIPAYVASKHAILGLTKTAALEYAKAGLRINAVCPGVIETPMVARLTHNNPKEADEILKGEPIGRIGKPDEIAQAVVWMCSDKASFVTGSAMTVDGGWVAR